MKVYPDPHKVISDTNSPICNAIAAIESQFCMDSSLSTSSNSSNNFSCDDQSISSSNSSCSGYLCPAIELNQDCFVNIHQVSNDAVSVIIANDASVQTGIKTSDFASQVDRNVEFTLDNNYGLNFVDNSDLVSVGCGQTISSDSSIESMVFDPNAQIHTRVRKVRRRWYHKAWDDMFGTRYTDRVKFDPIFVDSYNGDYRWNIITQDDNKLYRAMVTPRHLPDYHGPTYVDNINQCAKYSDQECRPIKTFTLANLNDVQFLPYVDFELYFLLKEHFVTKGRTILDRDEMEKVYKGIVSIHDMSRIPVDIRYKVKGATIWAVMMPDDFELGLSVSLGQKSSLGKITKFHDFNKGQLGTTGCFCFKRDLNLPGAK